MESVGILRVLWRRRVLVALGLLLASAVGILALCRVSLAPPGLERRAVPAGSATQRVLVDTPRSLLADARPEGVTSIVTRATVLGNLLASDEARVAMARQTGLRAEEIDVTGPGAEAAAVPTPLAEAAIETARPRQPYAITVSQPDPTLPILNVYVSAPDPAEARELAGAASAALPSAVGRGPVGGQSLRVEPVGRVQVASRMVGPGTAKAAIAAVVLFVFWCVLVLLVDAIQARSTGPGRRRLSPGSLSGGLP